MGKQFRKFKRRMWLGAILRAIFFGVFVGAVSLAAQWVYAKQTLSVINQTRSLVWVAVPAILGALIVLFVLMPHNKRLAAKLDRRYGLGEKVQTMLALRQDESDMAVLQRESAETAMANIHRRGLRGPASWIFFGLPLIGALAIYGALIMPIKAQPAPTPPPPPVVWKMDAYTEQKLLDLIAYVENSDMEEDLRYEVVGELEGLLIRLRSVRKETVMQEFVLQTAANIHNVVAEYNTYDLMADALQKSSQEAVRRLGGSIRTLKYLLINEQILSMGEALMTSSETETNAKATAESAESAEAGTTATTFAGELEAAVDRSGLSETDPLSAMLLTFAETLRNVTDKTDDRAIEDIVLAAQKAMEHALATPLQNEMVETTTLQKLMEIFGLTLPEELIKDNAYDPAEKEAFNPEDDDRELSNVGGIGSGEVHYGSNDTIYDDVTDTYITYGEVLARYYAAVMGQMEDGTLPADLEDMLNAYFERLHGAGDETTAG